MTDDSQGWITDPQRLRALAHPLRTELLDVLRMEGEATATRCAELTGESVASCSFHLRMLAKYRFIERAEQRGKEKPWRVTTRSFTASADFDDPASVGALREVAMLELERESQRVRDWIGRADGEPREWSEASVISRSTFWATAEEMAEVSGALSRLAERFTPRWDDPAKRPRGSRIVRLFGATTVDPVRDDAGRDERDRGHA